MVAQRLGRHLNRETLVREIKHSHPRPEGTLTNLGRHRPIAIDQPSSSTKIYELSHNPIIATRTSAANIICPPRTSVDRSTSTLMAE